MKKESWIIFLFAVAVLFFAGMCNAQNLHLPEIEKKEKLIRGSDIAAFGASFVGGYLFGVREALHAEPDILEKLYGVSPTGFGGSEEWRRKYKDFDSNSKMKTQAFGNFGRDYWHTSEKVSRATLVFSCVVPLTGKKNFKIKACKLGANLFSYSSGYFWGYRIRYKA